MLIAVIAAATTLIALTLTALVVLRITDNPKEPTAVATSPVLVPTATPTPLPTAVPTALPVATTTPLPTGDRRP